MPQLGETVTEGTVLRWCKQVGERIAVDEALLEVSTDKVDAEVPSPVAGEIVEILVAEGDTVPIGARLAVITESADDHGAGGALPLQRHLSRRRHLPSRRPPAPTTPGAVIPDARRRLRKLRHHRRGLSRCRDVPEPNPRSCRSPTSESERPRT